MYHQSVMRLVALFAALITLALLIYMAQPGGNNHTYQSFSGYIWLLGFAVWAILPYLMLFLMAKKVLYSTIKKLIFIIGTLIISIGGVALYVDAALLHRDPQGALVFIAVPLYQWMIVALLAGIHLVVRKSQSP